LPRSRASGPISRSTSATAAKANVDNYTCNLRPALRVRPPGPPRRSLSR
jgi:hypothetical protein